LPNYFQDFMTKRKIDSHGLKAEVLSSSHRGLTRIPDMNARLFSLRIRFQKNRVRFLILPLAIIIGLIVILYLVTNLLPAKNHQTFSQDQILTKLKNHQEIAAYTSLQAQVKYLNPKDLREQAKKFPVIYKDTRGDIYEVRYNSPEGGVMLIYDAQSDKILKTFSLLDWNQ